MVGLNLVVSSARHEIPTAFGIYFLAVTPSCDVTYLYYIPIFLVSPMDYGIVSTILEFGSCDTRQCTEIPIVDDMIVELTESFFVNLERTPGLDSRLTLDPVDGEIEIIDDDGIVSDMQILLLRSNIDVYMGSFYD